MLGGLDPVIIFQFSALKGTALGDKISSIPMIASIPTLIDQPPIPIYLSENLFNIIVDGESKDVDIQTTTETKADGTAPDVDQSGIQSSVTVHIEGKKDSVALTLLSAMVDQVFEKVTSKEYSITYLHGSITIFRGLLQSYSIESDPNNDKLRVKFTLSKGNKSPTPKAGIDPIGKSSPGNAKLI